MDTQAINPSLIDLVATLCFALAIIHTFSVQYLQNLAHRFQKHSVAQNTFELLGEVEIVFGIWAALFLILFSITKGTQQSIEYLESRNFTEAGFVFVIMAICSSRPLLLLVTQLIDLAAKILSVGAKKKPQYQTLAFYFSTLTFGPLLGSLITEPAAMTVTALILLERFFDQGISTKFKYSTLGLLFVNISIGGTLTHFAAPPVLMVAKTWNWDLTYMISHFGWKAALAIIFSTALVTFRFREELTKVHYSSKTIQKELNKMPLWVTILHTFLLVLIILSSHHLILCIGFFLFFLGLYAVTQEYQAEIKLKEGMLVAFFLGGLVILGGPQRWWLEPLITQLNALPLFLGATSLTAITDNAALTYLGAQVPSLSEASRYALVAGAVTGGGLTVIANAPNPAGYGILNASFGSDGISPLLLFTHALTPTLIAGLFFWLL